MKGGPALTDFVHKTYFTHRLHHPGLATGQFTAEGDEKINQFRSPAFVQADTTVCKNTHITERWNLQFRFAVRH